MILEGQIKWFENPDLFTLSRYVSLTTSGGGQEDLITISSFSSSTPVQKCGQDQDVLAPDINRAKADIQFSIDLRGSSWPLSLTIVYAGVE